MRIDELNALVSAVCPIQGINSDGVISYDPSATSAQKTAAQGVMTTNLPLLTQNSPQPDVNGFTQAVKAGLGGIVAANTLAVAYPLFFAAVQSSAWADLQALVIDAKTKAVITLAQYTAIKGAASTFNIPVTLP